MAGLNIANATTLYTNYLEGIDRSLNDKSDMRQMVRQDKPWAGSHLEWRVHVKRSGALGPVDDGAAVPVPNFQTHATAKVGRKMVGGSVQITEGMLATGSGSKNVAGDAVQIEQEGVEDELLKMENGFFFRNGDGSVATVKTGTTGTTLYVDDARMLWDGVTYQVYDSTLATLRGTLTVSTVTQAYDNLNSRATVTTSATVPSGTTAGDLIVWNGGVNKAISGLSKLITDSGTVQNILATTYPRHTSLIMSASADRDLTPALFRQMQSGLFQKAGADMPTAGLTVLGSAYQLMKVDELWESELRVTPDSKTGGLAMPSFQSSFGRFTIKPSVDATYGRLYFVDFSQVYRGVQKKLHWRKSDGGPIWETSQTSFVKRASVLEICELYIRKRVTSGQIQNLTEDNKIVAYG